MGSSPGPAQFSWGTAAAGPELAPVTGLRTVLLPELVKMRGVAGKEVVFAEVPGTLALVQRAVAGCKECGTVSHLAPGFLQASELWVGGRFLGQKHHLGKCTPCSWRKPQEGGQHRLEEEILEKIKKCTFNHNLTDHTTPSSKLLVGVSLPMLFI